MYLVIIIVTVDRGRKFGRRKAAGVEGCDEARACVRLVVNIKTGKVERKYISVKSGDVVKARK